MIKLINIKKSFKYPTNRKYFFKKDYKYITALDDISFEIKKGERVGYLGPNGAGKSSTIKIMCGILAPDEGSCLVDGLIPLKDRIKLASKIGVVFGNNSLLWREFPVINSFGLLKEIYKIDSKLYKENLNNLVEELNISDLIKRPLKSLSLGEKMRCEIAAVLLHSPDILFLDEPTLGLDVISKHIVRKIIKKECEKRNITLVVASHDMKDIEYLTNRIILISKGKILKDISLEQFLNISPNKKIINLTHNEPFLSSSKALKIVFQNGKTCIFELNTNILSTTDALKYILNKYKSISDISISETSSENALISLYKEFGI